MHEIQNVNVVTEVSFADSADRIVAITNADLTSRPGESSSPDFCGDHFAKVSSYIGTGDAVAVDKLGTGQLRILVVVSDSPAKFDSLTAT